MTIARDLANPSILNVTYDSVSNQAVTIDLEDDGVHNTPPTLFTANVNVYSSDTPTALFFNGITSIIVTVPNPTATGVNGNSLAIKGINTGTDRIILAGSAVVDPTTGGLYTNVAGRWSDETANGNQCLFTISGIDDLTVTAGGVINVSGSFVNDTNDASIHAIGQIVERNADQHTATVTVGETTPVPGITPTPWLFSNTVEIVGAEIDIYSDIGATKEVTLRAGDSASASARSNLVLPYDVYVTSDGTPSGTATGRIDLFSTQNISQLQTSKLVANRVVAVSNSDRSTALTGPWMIDLGSVDNAFNEIALGMVAAPGDAPNDATKGRVGVRNSIDLAVVDFGILAATGQVRIDNAGALTVSAPIQATGLILESDDSIVTTVGAIMRLGGLGVELYANDTFDTSATGDITLNGPITIQDKATPTTIVRNKIQAAGTITMAGEFISLLAGSTTVTSTSSSTGIVVSAPVQVGSTQLDANSTTSTVYDHDLILVAKAGAITVNKSTGGDAVPRTIQATNIISFDAQDSVTIAGSVFAGTIYGDANKLPATAALPAITIASDAIVTVTTTGSLQTQSYENDPGAYANSLLGRISIDAAQQVMLQGSTKADGPVDVTSVGDIYVYAPVTARESIRVDTRQGSIEVQGAVRTTGWTYTTTPPAPLVDQRSPDITLSAAFGGITTSALGTLSAGGMQVNGTTTLGKVTLQAQQDITLGADILTSGDVIASTTLGLVDVDALLQTSGTSSVAITAGNGIRESEGGRLVTGSLSLLNTNATDTTSITDIVITGPNNAIGKIAARNLSTNGLITVLGASAMAVSEVTGSGAIDVASANTLSIIGAVTSTNSTVSLRSTGADVVQAGRGIERIVLVSGGSAYTAGSTVTIAPPAAGGTAATARLAVGNVNSVTGVVLAIEIVTRGSGYAPGESPAVTFSGGSGASAIAYASMNNLDIAADGNITITGFTDVTLTQQVTSAAGDIAVSTTSGNLDLSAGTFFAHALAGSVMLDSNCGTVVVERVCAELDVTITGEKGVTVERDADAGRNITVTASAGIASVINLTAGDDIRVTAGIGSAALYAATVNTLQAGGDIDVAATGAVNVRNQMVSGGGDIRVTSVADSIELNSAGLPANLLASSGAITISAHGFVNQPTSTGVLYVQVISSGQVASATQPVVTVTIDAPASGTGTAATAAANLAQIGYQQQGGPIIIFTPGGSVVIPPGATPVWGVVSVTVTNPGSGYAPNERPLVTFSNIPNTVATAYSAGSLPTNIVAATDIRITGGSNVLLSSVVQSNTGGIAIASVSGNLDLSANTFFAHALAGSVLLDSDCGTVVVERVCAQDDVIIIGPQGVTVDDEVKSDAGGIGITADAGPVTVQDLLADWDITVLASGTITLNGIARSMTGDVIFRSLNGDVALAGAGVQILAPLGGVEFVSTSGAITAPPVLNVAGNISISGFAGMTLTNPLSSSGGSIALQTTNGALAVNANVYAADRITLGAKNGISQSGFLRADELVVSNATNLPVTLGNLLNNVNNVAATTLGSFTYVDADDLETGVNRGGPLGVEISADTISLQTQAAKSTIRVVSGLRYRSLSIAPGAGGVVDFVTTSEADNPAFNAAFSGTLRDMITYVNANQAVATVNGSSRPVRMRMVFNEDGYAVDELNVAATLPAFTKPVTVDGSRLESTVAVGRVGIKGSIGAASGLSFALGSAGSTVTDVAAYGFSRGSAIVLTSGGNTVQNSWLGLKANGTADGNRAGVEVFGAAAVGNLIGSSVFDTAKANRFGGNTIGIVVRDKAVSTRIVGNVVGVYDGFGAANGEGIRVNSASNTQIGDVDTVQWDLKPSLSNVIAGNTGNGVQIMNAMAGTYAAANRVRNNWVSGNGAGITVTGSQFAEIGGTVDRASNVVVSQRTSGVRVNRSSEVRILDNEIGIDPRGVDQTDILAGNGLDGIEIGDLSQRIEIAEGNRIGGNARHGISISGLQTRGVTITRNTIGGQLDDGTPAGNGKVLKGDGIAIIDAVGNSVAGGNVVSNNFGNGVSVTNASAQTLAQGNRIFGSRLANNSGDGIRIVGGARTTVGGNTAAQGNVIQLNANGISLQHSDASGAPTGHAIQANFVGTTRARVIGAGFGNSGAGIRIESGVGNTVSDGNAVMNNAGAGVEIRGGSANVIGSEIAGKGNLISRNAGDGVLISTATAAGPTARRSGLEFARAHVIQGNDISANGMSGIVATGAKVNGVTIGQSVTASGVKGVGNVIADNRFYGVVVNSGAQQVSVQGNSLGDNGIGGVSIADTANRSSFTTLAFQRVGGTPPNQTAVLRPLSGGRKQLEVYGRLTGAANQQYSIEIYANDPNTGNGVPQMRRFIGRVTVTANAAGVVDFSSTPLRITTTSLEVGEQISMSATALRFEAGSTKVSSSLATVELPGIRNPTF